MTTIADFCEFLESYAPAILAAEWDNVGLLVGERNAPVVRAMTCLTITPRVAAEAIRNRAELIVVHHPLPFKPLKRLTTDEPAGRMLWDLIRAGVSIYSPHTAFDSALAGINQQMAEGLGLIDVHPLEPSETVPGAGSGRFGRFAQAQSLDQVAARLKEFLKLTGLHAVGPANMPISMAGVACGSAGEFLGAAIRQGCQLLVTGETRLHTCYDAEASGIALLLAGHYASERFGVDRLAEILAAQFPNVTVWASQDERDPLRWV